MRSKPVEFALALEAACGAHPQQRTCQVLVNAIGPDPFYVEDIQAIIWLYEYASKGTGT